MEGPRSRVSLWHVAGSLGRLKSLRNRLKKVAPFPPPQRLLGLENSFLYGQLFCPFDVLTLLMLGSENPCEHVLTALSLCVWGWGWGVVDISQT